MRVLIADDDPVQLHQLKTLMARMGYEVLTAADGRGALEAFEASPEPIPLVIADWMMPEMDGLQLCREIRRRFQDRFIHIILLTSKDRPDDVVQGMDAGADDYLVKPVHHGELSARIRAARRIIDLQEKLLAAHEQLRVLALHDELTGVFNRRAILDTLDKELARADRQRHCLSVFLIDLDHFKQINDSHGHLAGDAVLREAVRRISATVRSYDAVGRYGGEEFLVVIVNLDEPGAHDLAERVRCAIGEKPVPFEGIPIPFTLSVGVATLPPGRKAEVRSLLTLADKCLYLAKTGGRDRTVQETVPAEEQAASH